MIIINSDMFQHQGAILRKSTITKELKSNMPIQVMMGNQYMNWHVGQIPVF
jgi:hypothetical protein